MKNSELYLRLVLPPVLCAFLIFMTNISLDYLPLSFGLIIGFTNWKAHKFKPLLGVLLSVLVSYISFVIAFLIFAAAGRIFDLGDSGGVLGLNFSTYIIAPLLLLLSYTFVFKIPKTRLTTLVIILSLVLLVSQNYLQNYMNSQSNTFLDNEILNPYIIWQVIMALALQIIIYQKQLFKSNNV